MSMSSTPGMSGRRSYPYMVATRQAETGGVATRRNPTLGKCRGRVIDGSMPNANSMVTRYRSMSPPARAINSGTAPPTRPLTSITTGPSGVNFTSVC
jgi:hypothetical protein